MGRGAEKQELGQPQPEHVAHRDRAARQRAFDRLADQRVDLAQPAQHRGGQKPREGAVAGVQRRQRRLVQRFVQGPVPAENRVKEIERGPPRRQSGHFHEAGV